MNAHRFWLQFIVVMSAVGLTAAVMYLPKGASNDVIEIVKQSLSVLWTLVAFIIRDIRNRDGVRTDKNEGNDE